MPALAFSYAIKIPSAGMENASGTGRVDHAFTFLASKDITHFHFDFNATQFLIGRPGRFGVDQNQQLGPAFSHVIRGGLQLTGKSLVRPDSTKRHRRLLLRCGH
jgi:hypothetical protein